MSAQDYEDTQAPLETSQAEGVEINTQPAQPPLHPREVKMSKEDLQTLVDSMYNPDKTTISREELDAILENPDIAGELTFAYHSITGGLSFIDESRKGVSTPIFTLKGNGELNRIQTAQLKSIIDNYPEHGETIYRMFETGEVTMERVAITDHLYAVNFSNQVNNFLSKHPTLHLS